MLLGDADVKGAVGEALTEQVEARARGHGCRDRHDLWIQLCVLHQLLGEHPGVLRRASLSLVLLARDHVELDHAVVFVCSVFGGAIALALLRDHVNQHRAVLDLPGVLQHIDQGVHVVAVDGTHVVEAELFKQRAAGDHAAGIFLGLAGGFLQRLGKRLRDRLAQVAQGLVAAARHEPGHVRAHAAYRRRDGHVVVVEDDR